MKGKYLWYTDTHLDKVNFWTKIKFIRHINKEKPKGLFITGDISNGFETPFDLGILARFIKCPIYFVLGNHDYYWTGIYNTNTKVKSLCKKYPNLIWLSEHDVIPLSEDTAIVGTEGWYDGALGNEKYLRFNLDWILIKELRHLPSMEHRIQGFKDLSVFYNTLVIEKLKKGLDAGFKRMYLLTHFPPWKEATRDAGSFLEPFWLAYNVNAGLGKMIEELMKNYPKQHVTVLAGHTHKDCWTYISKNIECKVITAKYYNSLRNEEQLWF